MAAQTSFQQNKTILNLQVEEKTTDQILLLTDTEQDRLKKELSSIYDSAFPNMPDDERLSHVLDYFIQPLNHFHRQTIFYRNTVNELIATTIFVQGKVRHKNRSHNSIYVMTRAILPEFRSCGLGKALALKVLTEYQPDVLFTTCAQSSSLHSWLRLSSKCLVDGFEVYPEVIGHNGDRVLKPIPQKDLDFINSALRQAYLEVAQGNQQSVNKAVGNLSDTMVRKGIYSNMYDFNPWSRNGREDILAKALGLSTRDGVLIVFLKKMSIH